MDITEATAFYHEFRSLGFKHVTVRKAENGHRAVQVVEPESGKYKYFQNARRARMYLENLSIKPGGDRRRKLA